LRSDAGWTAPATLAPAQPVDGSPGLYRLEPVADPLTTELRLTVSAPGHAPQVVSVPYKAGVTRYLTPIVLFPAVEVAVPAGAAGRTLTLQGDGRTATLQLGGTDPMQLRYAFVDGRFAPGAGQAATGGLLQSVAVLYLENVGKAAFPPGTEVTLGTTSTTPIVGAEGSGGAYVLDLQAAWKRRAEASVSEDARAGRLRPSSGGFWTVANHTPKPACLRGRVVKRDGTPCPGARVRLIGPDGVGGSDSAGGDGSFCSAAAQQEAAIVAVGGSTAVVYAPETSRTGASCAQADACSDVGPITVADVDCEAPAVPVVGQAQVGQPCTTTLDCRGLASCYQGFCVGEGYARVSLTWAARSDFDLHVKLPDGRALYEKVREIKGVGRVDLEQCSQVCTGDKHVENVILQAGAQSAGGFEAWVENYGGLAGGMAEIEIFVAGKPRLRKAVTVPPVMDGKSEVVSFTLP
jgi:hypothetical protein